MLRCCVFSEVSTKELLTCHRNDTRYIFFSLVNKFDAVIRLASFHFLDYNVICAALFINKSELN